MRGWPKLFPVTINQLQLDLNVILLCRIIVRLRIEGYMIFLVSLMQATLFAWAIMTRNPQLSLPVQGFLIILNGVSIGVMCALEAKEGESK
jgi:hypothetical protein